MKRVLDQYDNAALTSVSRLSGLKGDLGGSLRMQDNPLLATLYGLGGITGISGTGSSGYSLF